MIKIFMTDIERNIMNNIIDENKFWLYGDKKACFKEDVIQMILLALRHRKPEDL